MTTITAVKRALEETRDEYPNVYDKAVFETLANNEKFVTILANRLSDRGEAGNAARDKNLADLDRLWKRLISQGATEARALEWAIDQLTPPQVQS